MKYDRGHLADPKPIEIVEDRLWVRLRDAGFSHENVHLWLLRTSLGSREPCDEGCVLCALIPHVRAAMTEAANAKFGEAARLLRLTIARWGEGCPGVREALEPSVLALEGMTVPDITGNV